MKPFFLGRRWTNNQRKSNSVWYNTLHWKITALISCARISPKLTLITAFVSIVTWKQAWWPPLFITFLISPCLVTATYQVSSEIYGGFFYYGITLTGIILTEKIIRSLNAHWLVFIVNKSTDRYTTPCGVNLDISTNFHSVFNAVISGL